VQFGLYFPLTRLSLSFCNSDVSIALDQEGDSRDLFQYIMHGETGKL
jgi:hypothetical protein